MATLPITYSFTNGTTADATQVNKNFTDVKNFAEAALVQVDGSVQAGTSAIANLAVTTGKIADGAITVGKLAAGVAVSGPQGAQGAQGATGATGPQGFQGATGAQGAAGATGPQGAGYANATSSTSLAIGTGSKVFTITAGSAFVTGSRVRAANTTTPTNYMEGIVTVSGTTMTMTSDATGGSGTFSAWTISIAGNVGAGGTGTVGPQGAQGAQGAIGATGPQGFQGFQGATGSTGPQGPQGFQGATGATGPQGSTGATGPSGTTGWGSGSDGTVVFQYNALVAQQGIGVVTHGMGVNPSVVLVTNGDWGAHQSPFELWFKDATYLYVKATLQTSGVVTGRVNWIAIP